MNEFNRSIAQHIRNVLPSSTEKPIESVTLTKEELDNFSSRLVLDSIDKFIRHQRKAGIQTVLYANSGRNGSIHLLIDSLVEEGVLRETDRSAAFAQLSERVLDVSPLVDDKWHSVFAMHTSAAWGVEGNIPQVKGRALRYEEDGSWDIRVKCPYCNEIHKHGGGKGDKPDGGHRHAHCLVNTEESAAGYIIAEIEA